MSRKFVKKPLVIEAFQCGANDVPEWAQGEMVRYFFDGTIHYALIKTHEGLMRAEEGDFIIKGIKGELYPCKPDVFHATYDEADPNLPKDTL